MEQAQRVHFSGFVFLENKDNATHEVDVGYIQVGEVKYTLDMIKSRQSPYGDFLPASVRKDGIEIWRFKDMGFKGIAVLVETMPGNPVICLVSGIGKGRQLEQVIPLLGFSHLQRVSIHNVITFINPNEDVNETIKIKHLAGEKLGVKILFSKNEERFIEYNRKEKIRLKKEEEDRRAVKRQEDVRKQKERVTVIMSRKKIVGFTADGKPLSGIPVTQAEYQCLPNSTYVILVESYDQSTKKHAGVSLAFRISKTPGGRVDKVHSTSVVEINPVIKTTPEAVLEATRVFLIEHESIHKNVLVFTGQNEIRVAREQGLNGGTYVTAETTRQKDGRFEIYEVRSDGMQTLGYFKPLE